MTVTNLFEVMIGFYGGVFNSFVIFAVMLLGIAAVRRFLASLLS